MSINFVELTRARESRAAIERLYIEMRHLFNQGFYRKLGAEGEVLTDALLTLSPEIYGTMRDEDKVELDGLVYVFDRLPKGIEACRFVRLISEEGYAASAFEKIVPVSRRRNCYRIDEDHMFIEVTRGRSEIYDILTHLTFLYIEARKIGRHAIDANGKLSTAWRKLETIVKDNTQINDQNKELALTYLSTLLGGTFEETLRAYERFKKHPKHNNGLFRIIYELGCASISSHKKENKYREISFSPTLRTRIGHHIYGESWAYQIKDFLLQQGLIQRPIHIISANLHSVLNCLYAWPAAKKEFRKTSNLTEIATKLGSERHKHLNKIIREYARQHGLWELDDPSGTNISVQIIDPTLIDIKDLHPDLKLTIKDHEDIQPVLIIMDYAFGEQAFETMDELLKPHKKQDVEYKLPVASISIMGKAGILEGGKGDIMVPNAHIFEGTADNYPFTNAFRREDFAGYGLNVVEGPMITVLGTSLQNRDVLSYFKNSSWGAIGLEMEGAHYQKAIQAASKIRKSIRSDVVLRYAYYASDNPLLTGSTLASGSLGITGIKPTYLITMGILKKIYTMSNENEVLSAEEVKAS